MKVVLELQGQSSNIQRITVRHDIVIGRGSDCNLRISTPQVSRRHCFLRISRDGVAITDLESSNGTWLDGERMVPRKRYFVDDGMKITVGPIRFVARITEEIPAAEILSQDGSEADSVIPLVPVYEAVVPPNPAESGSMDFAIERDRLVAEVDESMVDNSSASGQAGWVEVEVIQAGVGHLGDSAEVAEVDDEDPTAMEDISSVEVLAVEVVDPDIPADDVIEIDCADADSAGELNDVIVVEDSAEIVKPDIPDAPPNASWFDCETSGDGELDDFLRYNTQP